MLRLLVFGGSQGARVLNDVLVALIPTLRSHQGRVRLTHQTGPATHAAVARAYADAGFTAAEVVPYLDDMPARFADTDLVISRSGATTVAELAASGTPAILVPFARATGGHQAQNARAHASAGAAAILEEHELTPDALWSHVGRLLESPAELARMGAAARARAVPDAAARIVDRLLEVAA